jgi:hypothetical protein
MDEWQIYCELKQKIFFEVQMITQSTHQKSSVSQTESEALLHRVTKVIFKMFI